MEKQIRMTIETKDDGIRVTIEGVSTPPEIIGALMNATAQTTAKYAKLMQENNFDNKAWSEFECANYLQQVSIEMAQKMIEGQRDELAKPSLILI